MRMHKSMSIREAFREAGCVLGRTAWGAAAVGAVAALYGVFYGILDGLIHCNLWRPVSAGLYFAVCGSIAGALVGGIGRMVDPEGIADLTCHSVQGAEQKDCD